MTLYLINGYETDPAGALTSFFSEMLENHVDYLFLPGKSPWSQLPMPMLISDKDKICSTSLLAPVMPFNSARQAAAILKSDTGKKTALFLRPCEKRALIELEKLNQCSLDNGLIITADCRGRFENRIYLELLTETPDLAAEFLYNGRHMDKITSTCSSCTQLTDDTADLNVNFIGTQSAVTFSAHTEKGIEILEKFDCREAGVQETRKKEISRMLEQRSENLKELTRHVLSQTEQMIHFQKIVGNCLNCHNCRTACPVCYCRECVFLTDIFSHTPETLLNRADKKGVIKLPADTTMFHMTRLAHMSHACVGCGQCSSVCPSDIPVADIFRVISKKTQDFFQYMPGRNTADKIPYLNYKKET